MPQKHSIIDIANAAFAMPTSTQSQLHQATTISDNNSMSTTISLDDRLDAARSLLGISPSSVADSSVATHLRAPSSSCGGKGIRFMSSTTTLSFFQQQQPSSAITSCQEGGESTASSIATNTHWPRSNSAGLEALAFLATQQQQQQEDVSSSGSTTTSTISNTGSIILPITSHGIAIAPSVASAPRQPLVQPPPNQRLPVPSITTGAVSSSSSDDDDSEAMPPPPPRYTRRRRSISNPEGMEKYAPFGDYFSPSSRYSSQQRLHLVLPASILEEELAEASAAMKAKEEEAEGIDAGQEEAVDVDDYDEENDGELADNVDDDECLDHEQLLRRARSRLLEDLSQVNLSGEKGVTMLPHSLAKYKEVYNKNGRIGIYTPAERAAIIARFQSKRSRRVWNKKIRYNCRKSLADRRMRVKGRFVKRSTLEAQLEQDHQEQPDSATNTSDADAHSTSVTFAPNTEKQGDEDMPDVNDPEAGFSPTEDQPYRRLRRHTIT